MQRKSELCQTVNRHEEKSAVIESEIQGKKVMCQEK